ncbi:hypothetical protein FAGAP_236 [Fusarium agapanthi]|uniref:Cell wall protein n=1 Tax=Fusarium agapanthi TaxID=1803897 RepID=A0A9P5BK16_9HYPO|nr:hypothetical protein FAGAP_236 [Fusarium agapanthi]
MKSVIGLALLSVAFAAPQDGSNAAAHEKRQFSPTDLDAFFDSLSSLLGQLPTEPTQTMTDILTFSTSVSGTPTEVTVATTTSDAFDGGLPDDSLPDGGLPFGKRQAPGDLEAIISSLSALISPATTTTEAIGCATDVVGVPTTVNGVPTEVSSLAAVPTTASAVPAAPIPGAPAAPAVPGGV